MRWGTSHPRLRLPLLALTVSAIASIVGMTAGRCAADNDVLNPKTYRSPDGRYECYVDPSTIEGAGVGSYHISVDGKVVWTGKKPFTFREAFVTNVGVVAGYAYEGGVGTGGQHGTEYNGLIVAMISPDGTTLMRDAAQKHPSNTTGMGFNGSDSSRVDGMIIDVPNDRFAICITDQNGMLVWWNYHLSSHKPIGDTSSKPPTTGPGWGSWPVEMQIVPETPLTVVVWYEHNEIKPGLEHNAIVTLVDAAGNEVWGSVYAGEYDALVGEESFYRWCDRHRGRQIEAKSHAFSFRSFSNAASVGYTVVAEVNGAGGWRVEAGERVPDEPPLLDKLSRGGPPLEAIELEHVGTITLASETKQDEGIATPYVESPYGFCFDETGAIGFVRQVRDEAPQLVRVSTSGRLLTKMPLNLEGVQKSQRLYAVPTGSRHWFLIQQEFGDASHTRAWRFDSTSGSSERIPQFEVGRIEQIEPTPGGGFAIRVLHRLQYTMQEELVRFDANGTKLWGRREDGYGEDLPLDSIAPLSDGTVVGLGHFDTFAVFDEKAKIVETMKISEIIGREPNYAADVYPDVNGGFFFRDFDGDPSIYRIDANRKVIASFTPRYGDGTPIESVRRIQVEPDGTIWTMGRYGLLRLNDEGEVDRIIGRDPSDDTLTTADTICVDPRGFIYARNPRTRAVHVFDTSGNQAGPRVIHPAPVDVEQGVYPDILIARDDGEFAIAELHHEGKYLDESVLRGAPAWTDAGGFRAFALADEFQDGPCFLPDSLTRWERDYTEIIRIETDPSHKRIISRRLDYNWLNYIEGIATDHRGRLVAIAGAPMFSDGSTRTSLNVYDQQGTPLHCMYPREESGFARVALTDRYAITVEGDRLYLYDLTLPDESPPREFTIPDEGESGIYWRLLISPDESEVWLHESGTLRIERYRLP